MLVRTLTLLCLHGLIVSNAAAQNRRALNLEDAVSTALSKSYSIRQQLEEVRRREAELRIAEGAFDITLGFSAAQSRVSTLHGSAERRTLDVSASLFGNIAYRAGASRRLRSGVLIQPGVEFSRQDSRTFQSPSLIRTGATLALEYPLFQRGGLETAAVDAAELTLSSENFRLRETRARSIYSVAGAYWQYRGASEALDILSESEAKARRLLAETASLVAAGEQPSSDLDQLRADLADRIGARLRAEQAVLETRQLLGLELGLSPSEAGEIGPPGTSFPAPDGLSPPPSDERARRPALESAGLDLAAAEILLRARRNASRPQVSLRLEGGYSGLTEGDIRFGQHLPPLGQNDVSGGSASLSLVMDFPAENNTAGGLLARQEAFLRQAALRKEELEKTISSNILMADAQLRSSAAELREVEEAVRLYAASVESEKKKLRLNVSTQFDLILVEERLRNATLTRVAAQVRFAQAVARLRYETGTLLSSDGAAETANRLLSPIRTTNHE